MNNNEVTLKNIDEKKEDFTISVSKAYWSFSGEKALSNGKFTNLIKRISRA
jgi:hypothetical protein